MNDSIELSEGEMKEMCLVVDDEKVQRREVPVSLTIISNTIANGMFIFITVAINSHRSAFFH